MMNKKKNSNCFSKKKNSNYKKQNKSSLKAQTWFISHMKLGHG